MNKQKLFSVMGYSKNSIFAFSVDIEGPLQIREFLHLQIQSPSYAPAFQKIDKENIVTRANPGTLRTRPSVAMYPSTLHRMSKESSRL